MKKNIKKCCFCGCVIEGYGNNPAPVKKTGRCCDICNYAVVLPARIAEFEKHSNKVG